MATAEHGQKRAESLTMEQLVRFVDRLHVRMYRDAEEERWDAGLDVNGGDLVELAGEMFSNLGMVPLRDYSFDEDEV